MNRTKEKEERMRGQGKLKHKPVLVSFYHHFCVYHIFMNMILNTQYIQIGLKKRFIHDESIYLKMINHPTLNDKD